jgi:ubiquinone/menaquinone biosynthesis C-methylase UbiE
VDQQDRRPPTVTRLARDQTRVTIEELGDGRRRVTLAAGQADGFVPVRSCETAYPVELIERMFHTGAPTYLCAEILREESDHLLRLGLRNYLLSYVDEREFEGRRVLDYGCGAGASTVVLARMFPSAQITALGHFDDLLALAEDRARLLGVENVAFAHSESRAELPPDLGKFRFIVLSGVYEHLLPAERRLVLPKLWQALERGGVLFVNQTPNRMYPLEEHTTGLPLVNYLPAPLALRVARTLSPRIGRDASWQSLLQGGIRGATRREILRNLAAAPGEAVLLRPSRLDARAEADIWYAVSMSRNARSSKRLARPLFKLAGRLTGDGDLVPILHLAIRKT